MKNRKLYFGIMLMGMGISFNITISIIFGTIFMGLGALFFISGMRELRKENEKNK